MTRFKVLGLALVAVCAMGVMASSAMAAGIEFEGGANMPKGKVMGEQPAGTNDVFTVDGSNVTCNNATYNEGAEIANGTENLKLHPVYSNCTAFGFIGANVDTTGCNYTGKATGTYNAELMKWNSAELKIECGANPIKINAGSGTCVADVGSQTLTTGLDVTNTTNNPMDFHLKAENVSVAVNKTVDGFGCPFNGTGATTGTYNGAATFVCTNPSNDAVTGCTIV